MSSSAVVRTGQEMATSSGRNSKAPTRQFTSPAGYSDTRRYLRWPIRGEDVQTCRSHLSKVPTSSVPVCSICTERICTCSTSGNQVPSPRSRICVGLRSWWACRGDLSACQYVRTIFCSHSNIKKVLCKKSLETQEVESLPSVGR